LYQTWQVNGVAALPIIRLPWLRLCYNRAMHTTAWPDPLTAPTSLGVASLLSRFWNELEPLADLLARHERLLAAEQIARLRATVIEMMLALNGIARPATTRHLNTYLSASQRAALEKSLLAPATGADAWLGQAVALVVIYRWYAPQLATKFALDYPAALEAQVWTKLIGALPDWPAAVHTDPVAG
jgi:hypothetical protein